MTLKDFTKLPIFRYLGVCNVLHIIMGVSMPSLLIESTDSIILLLGKNLYVMVVVCLSSANRLLHSTCKYPRLHAMFCPEKSACSKATATMCSNLAHLYNNIPLMVLNRNVLVSFSK